MISGDTKIATGPGIAWAKDISAQDGRVLNFITLYVKDHDIHLKIGNIVSDRPATVNDIRMLADIMGVKLLEPC